MFQNGQNGTAKNLAVFTSNHLEIRFNIIHEKVKHIQKIKSGDKYMFKVIN